VTGAEYDTRRRLLGLSVEEAARLHGVQDRTIRRWTRGVSPVPDDAALALLDLEDRMEKAVGEAVKLAKAEAGTAPVALYRYRSVEAQTRSPHASSLPLGAHAMLIGWTADALDAEGFGVAIGWAG
jgi:hypothetical protein